MYLQNMIKIQNIFDMQPPYQWELLADRLGISNHRSQLTLILLNQRGLLPSYKLLVSLNSGSLDLLSQYKSFVLNLPSCTAFTLCTLSIPPVLEYLVPLLKDANLSINNLLSLFQIDSTVQWVTSVLSITLQLNVLFQIFYTLILNCYYLG